MLHTFNRISGLNLRRKLLIILSVISVIFLLIPYTLNRTSVHVKNKAIIIDALASDIPNTGFIDSAVKSIKSGGFSVDLINGSDVTVKALRTLPSDYKIVIFRVHSEAFKNQVFLFTTEPYSDFKYLAEQIRFEVTGARPRGVGTPVFAVGLNFMKRYMTGKFDGSIVIVMGCRGLYNGSQVRGQEELGSSLQTAEWFLEQGASAYIGWDGLVNLHHTDKATAFLLEVLCIEKIDPMQAVEETMKKVGPDMYGSILRCVMPNNGEN